MDLGTRVKNALNSPESTVASHGEVDQNTPGAFPETPGNESGPDTTDPALVGTGSHHNKLHKRDDPRGWVGDNNAGLSHKHTDSGVGLTGDHDNSSTRQPGAIPGLENPGAYTHSAPDVKSNTTSNPLSNTTSNPRSSTTSNAPPPTFGQGNPTQTPWTQTETDLKADPYRDTGAPGGVAPLLNAQHDEQLDGRQMATRMTESQPTTTSTTDNTIAGSTTTDTAAAATDNGANKHTRQPDEVVQEHPYWGDLPRGTGVYNSVTGHGSEEDQKKRQEELYQQEKQSLSEQHPSTAGGVYNSVTGHGSEEDNNKRQGGIYQQETGDLSGQHPSTVAGLSGVSKVQEPSSQISTGSTEPRGDTSKFDDHEGSHKKEALAGAGGTATATAAAATAYRMHQHDNEPQDKSLQQEHSSEKESRSFGGLFNRSKASDDHHGRDKVKEEKPKHADEPKSEKHHALGGLFNRSSADENKHDDAAANAQKDKDHADVKHDSSNTAAYATGGAGLAAGGTAAYLASRDRKHDDEQVRDGSTSGQQYQSLISSEHQPEHQHSTDHASRGYDETRPSHNTTGNAAAAATAAGLGGGVLSSRRTEGTETKPRDETTSLNQPTLGSGRGTQYADDTTTRTGPSDTSNNTIGSADNSTHGANSNTGALSSGSAGETRPPPVLAEHANHGEYNVLSSGTPSGVRLDDSKDSASHAKPTVSETREEGHNKSTGVATGLGAAGLGAAAGAAAYRSSDRQDEERRELEKLKPAEEEQVKRYEREEARSKPESGSIPLIPGSGSQKSDKVIHQCQKCGEENDISHYFTQERKQAKQI